MEFSELQTILGRIVSVCRALEPQCGGNREIEDRYAWESSIYGQEGGWIPEDNSIGREYVFLLPAVRDTSMVLVLVDVGDLNVPLSMAATWRHGFLQSLAEKPVIWTNNEDGSRWSLSWFHEDPEYTETDIAVCFGLCAAARARPDALPVVLRRTKLEE